MPNTREQAPLWKAFRDAQDVQSLGPPIAHQNNCDARAIAVTLYGEPVVVVPFVVLRLPCREAP